MRQLLAPEQWETQIAAWLDWLRAAARPKTTLYLRAVQMRRVGRAFPDSSPWDVTSDQLVAWIGSHTWDNDTIRSHRAALRSFYAWAGATGRTTTNPAGGLPSVKSKPGIPRPAREDLWKQAMLAAAPRDALMIRLGAEAGLRACEICRVHTRDVEPDLTGYSLRVIGKGGKMRVVPLSPRLALDLRARPAGWVFPGNIDGHLSAAYVSKRLSRALGEDTTGHMLRHRFASAAYAGGGRDIRAVPELMGHSTPQTTARYTAVPNGALRAAVLAAAS